MNAQPSRTPWHPRILMVPAATAREGAALAAAAAHARDLGFDHLLLAGPAEPARIEAACRSATDHGIRLHLPADSQGLPHSADNTQGGK